MQRSNVQHIKFCLGFEKLAMETLVMIQKVFGSEQLLFLDGTSASKMVETA